ncbi:hypothetical protein VE02_05434 [Pseudogymnoascus sp. 03VT05]|nr:hypothetical protein VE02_05434 [Pseudogymnoascus sp. 03VT05]
MRHKGLMKEKAPWTRYKDIIVMIRRAHIFYSPVRNQCYCYTKPSEYLAIAFYESGRSIAQIASDIERLVSLRNEKDRATISGLASPADFADIVAEEARQYLRSFPGNDAFRGNSQHGWFRALAGGQATNRDHLEVLYAELLYRNELTRIATRCKVFLQLRIEDAHLFDTWTWRQEQEPDKQWDRFVKIREAIHDASVFGHPAPNQGFFFEKPTEYLAIAFVKSGRPMEEVLAEIEMLAINS